MKAEFKKKHHNTEERFLLQREQRWIYIRYTRGDIEKGAYILRNESNSVNDYLTQFFNDNHVSQEIRMEVTNYLNSGEENVQKSLQEFINYLLTTFSVIIMAGISLGLIIFGGYKGGSRLDETLNLYPTFTIIGVLGGLVIGGGICYLMFYKYLKSPDEKDKESKSTQLNQNNKKEETTEWLIIDVTLEDVVKAVRSFSERLPKGVYRTILVNDDYSIDFKQLAYILKGIPSKPFYMSKETYDIFEEKNKDIPPIIDTVQKAVDRYVKEQKKYPMLPYDPLRRVNYYLLIQEHYLEKKPDIELYITDYDGLISHEKPKRKQAGD
ncbi:DUF3939 domain-containing protein [Mesobacillus maritimus]|uniref:DUF3939 domain-containing protein n=1 Tax=Mesobacillus maritimus TaxID=1643336 RepID=UPI0038517664